MAFRVMKVGNHGANHPVVARLQMQTAELLGFTDFGKETQERLFRTYYDTSKRLLKCYDLQEKLLNGAKATIDEVLARPLPHHDVPYLIGLEQDVESFLYEAKNYFRDLTGAFRVAYGTPYKDASDFWGRDGKPSNLEKWAIEKFGTEHNLPQFLAGNAVWIAELVKRRNAVEHPREKSGTLFIQNFEVSKEGLVINPVWFRNAQQPTDILSDLKWFSEMMLVFAEEILAFVVQDHVAVPIVEIHEIPEEMRHPETPMRFKMQLKPEFALPPEANR